LGILATAGCPEELPVPLLVTVFPHQTNCRGKT
jgi:hypothetical protein